MAITNSSSDFWNKQLINYSNPNKLGKYLKKNLPQTLCRIAKVIHFITTTTNSEQINDFFKTVKTSRVFLHVQEGAPGSEKILESFYSALKGKHVMVVNDMISAGMPLAPMHLELGITNGCFSLVELKEPMTDEQINYYLYLACKAGNTAVAFHMAKRGGNIMGNIMGTTNPSPLLFAYHNGHRELSKQLLLKTAYRSENNQHNQIMIWLKGNATKNNDLEMLRFISSFLGKTFDETLAKKSALESSLQNKFKQALLSNNKEFLDSLILNYTTYEDLLIFLTTAVELGDLEVSVKLFELLIKIGRLSESTDSLRVSVIPKALKNDMNSFVKQYLEIFPKEVEQVFNDACKVGNIEIANLCLQMGANCNKGELLINSMENGNIATARWVMSLIPKSKIRDVNIHLSMAAALKNNKSGIKEILLLLAERGFDLFYYNKYGHGCDPLYTSHFHKAALAGWKDVTDIGLSQLVRNPENSQILFDHGSLLTDIDKKEEYDAMLASLVHAKFRTWDVKNIMRACSKNGLIQTLKKLLETHPQRFSMLKEAVNGHHDEVAHLLLERGDEYLSKYPESFYALYKRCSMKNLQTAEAAMLGQFKTLYLTGATHINGKRILYPSQFLQETLFGETINTHKIALKGSEQMFYVNLDILQKHQLLVEFLSSGEIEGVDPEYFEHLLSFLLNRELPDSYTSVKALIALSDKFKLYDLQIAIDQWIQTRPECSSWSKKLTLINA